MPVQIALNHKTSTSAQWDVTTPGNNYRVISYWSVGDQRKSWLVEAEAKLRNGERGWRRIKGTWLINAVREHENAATAAQQ